MASRYKTKTSYAKKDSGFEWVSFLQLLPVYLTVGLLPFMVRLHLYDTGLQQFPWYYANVDPMFGDTFLYFRQWWFTAIAFYMLFVLLWKLVVDRKSFRFSVACVPMAVFAVFAFLSAVTSDYRNYCFSGSFEQFENVFVLMGYALMVYYILIVVQSEREVKSILNVLTVSTLGLGLIGTLQTLGYNIMGTDFAKSLIIPSYIQVDMQITTGDNTAFMTLYNPNYVGVYVAMLFPMYATLLLFAKKHLERLVYAVTLVLLLIGLYGSGSKAAFLVIAVEMVVLLVFMRRPILKFWYVVIPAATALVCIFLLVNQAQDNVYTQRIAQALRMHKTEYTLESIETMDDGVYIRYKGNELKVAAKNYGGLLSFVVTDEAGNEPQMSLQENGYVYVMEDERFAGMEMYFLQYEEYIGFCVNIEGHDWVFTNEYAEDGSYYYLTTKGMFDKLHMAEQVIFNDYERVLSGRGYIWSVSIPLLKEHFILGSGADTFVMTFPQQDYLRLWRNGFAEQIMSKPHSLYLQVGVQDGVIALLAMLAFFVMYLGYSVRLYIASRFESFYECAGVAVMLAVLGFAVMGISNDSSITVSPIFWVLAGLGVWLNSKSAELLKSRKSASESVTE